MSNKEDMVLTEFEIQTEIPQNVGSCVVQGNMKRIVQVLFIDPLNFFVDGLIYSSGKSISISCMSQYSTKVLSLVRGMLVGFVHMRSSDSMAFA